FPRPAPGTEHYKSNRIRGSGESDRTARRRSSQSSRHRGRAAAGRPQSACASRPFQRTGPRPACLRRRCAAPSLDTSISVRRQVAKRVQDDSISRQGELNSGIAQRCDLDRAFGTIHRIQVARISRMAAKFGNTVRKSFEYLDKSVSPNELGQAAPGVILSVKAAVIMNPRIAASKWHIKLARSVQKDRLQRRTSMDVLMRVQVCRLGPG